MDKSITESSLPGKRSFQVVLNLDSGIKKNAGKVGRKGKGQSLNPGWYTEVNKAKQSFHSGKHFLKQSGYSLIHFWNFRWKPRQVYTEVMGSHEFRGDLFTQSFPVTISFIKA